MTEQLERSDIDFALKVLREAHDPDSATDLQVWAADRIEAIEALLREARTWVDRGADYNGSRSEFDSAELCNRIDAALGEKP